VPAPDAHGTVCRVSQPSKVRRLAKLVIEQTGGGVALVEFLNSVAMGLVDGASMRDRLEAAKVLLDRGYGRAPVQIEVTGQVTHAVTRVDVHRLTDEELEFMRRTLRRAVVKEALPAPAEEVDDAVVEDGN
jgi:hypothetical protein